MLVKDEQEVALGDWVEFEGKEYKFDSVGTQGVNIRDLDTGEIRVVSPMQLKAAGNLGGGDRDTRTEEQIRFDDIKQKQREEQDIINQGNAEADKIARDLDEERRQLREEELKNNPQTRLDRAGEMRVKEQQLSRMSKEQQEQQLTAQKQTAEERQRLQKEKDEELQRLEQEKQQREETRLEQERLEQERLEQERLEQEQAAANVQAEVEVNTTANPAINPITGNPVVNPVTGKPVEPLRRR